MPLDAICLRALINELDEQLVGSRVEKVYQPDREEIILALRGGKGAKKLLICASASAARMHCVDATRENPAAPPMFCMLLRKHIQGAKIASITQNGLERIAIITLDTTDELGVASQKYLHCELMGKHSNIVLCDQENRVLDALRRLDGDVVSGKRQILPGLFYQLPPAQAGKVNPLEVSGAGVVAALKQDAQEEKGLDKWLLSSFFGVSPLLCRELAYRATGDVAKPICMLHEAEYQQIADTFSDFVKMVQEARFHPCLLTKTGEDVAFEFTFFAITQYENAVFLKNMSSFSDMLIAFYEKKERIEQMRRRSQDLQRMVTTARDRLRRKLSIQQQELAQSEHREQYRRMGDLITANLYQIAPGMRTASVVDYYDEQCPTVEIRLDLKLTPQQNAQHYFKLYNKAKTAEIVLQQQIESGTQELTYLESVLESIEQAENTQDLLQLREELLLTGYLSKKQLHQGKNRSKPVQAKPYHYRTSDGFDVFAGKNNLQNDLLTLKTAYKSDIWFHTQKIHGSHVILVADGRKPTDIAMTEAAEIAAHHSKARYSAQVPVDYSEVRNIKKPAGAKPGFVIYHVYQTAYVTPSEQKIEQLRVR